MDDTAWLICGSFPTRTTTPRQALKNKRGPKLPTKLKSKIALYAYQRALEVRIEVTQKAVAQYPGEDAQQLLHRQKVIEKNVSHNLGGPEYWDEVRGIVVQYRPYCYLTKDALWDAIIPFGFICLRHVRRSCGSWSGLVGRSTLS